MKTKTITELHRKLMVAALTITDVSCTGEKKICSAIKLAGKLVLSFFFRRS